MQYSILFLAYGVPVSLLFEFTLKLVSVLSDVQVNRLFWTLSSNMDLHLMYASGWPLNIILATSFSLGAALAGSTRKQ